MGRKLFLNTADDLLLDVTGILRLLKSRDITARRSKAKPRLKPKFTVDIKKIDLLTDTIVTARKLLRSLPKAVQ